jgi:amino acid transporter
MYGKVGTFAAGAAGTAGTAGSGALAYTGVNVLALVVAALTLMFAGLALLKLAPRRASQRG